MSKLTIVWFRRDLRLHDNPAWNAALEIGAPIIPLFIHCPGEEGSWKRGAASNWWLHHALEDLSKQLTELGKELVIINAEQSLPALEKVMMETEADTIFWNRCYDPKYIERDTKIKKQLSDLELTAKSFNGSLLLDPFKVTNKSGNPYQVFTPFWKHCRDLEIEKPHTSSEKAIFCEANITHDSLGSLNLLPEIPWDKGMAEFWNPTRQGALDLLKLAESKAPQYSNTRDTPSEDGTSRLSPYLHFGQISPREFFHHILSSAKQGKETAEVNDGILRQLYWREFSAHLLYHFQHSQDHALKPQYEGFPWDFDEALLRSWQKGQTGYPIVDAAMRQLWHTGWMHNRARMIVGSLLVKHLLQPWQEGARWFWDTLVDADLANNSMGWQWIAGSGADASPYFRIFNPITQGKKFDASGDYVRKWCPELAKLPNNLIHTPWEATPIELRLAGITLGKDYPEPVITHEDGRKKALDAYAEFKVHA